MNITVNAKVRIPDHETYCCETHNPEDINTVEAIVVRLVTEFTYDEPCWEVVTERLETEHVIESLILEVL